MRQAERSRENRPARPGVGQAILPADALSSPSLELLHLARVRANRGAGGASRTAFPAPSSFRFIDQTVTHIGPPRPAARRRLAPHSGETTDSCRTRALHGNAFNGGARYEGSVPEPTRGHPGFASRASSIGELSPAPLPPAHWVLIPAVR